MLVANSDSLDRSAGLFDLDVGLGRADTAGTTAMMPREKGGVVDPTLKARRTLLHATLF